MVVPRIVYYWTLLVSLTVFFVYFSLFNISATRSFPKNREYFPAVKKVVAYSLLKRIEIESERYDCEIQYAIGENNFAINWNEGTSSDVKPRWQNDENLWRKIEGLYVSSVNLDRRLEPYHYIRIIGMVKGNWNGTLYCHVRISNGTRQITRATISPIWSKKWDENDTNTYFNPVLLSCSLPFGTIPQTVALSAAPCEQISEKNIFTVEASRRKRNAFTVCVKPLEFSEDISVRLMQWIEISRILGAQKIEMYVGKVRKNVWRMLNWYNQTYPGQIVVRRFKRIPERLRPVESFDYKIWQRRRYEVVAYNNCFYRNVETSKFVIPLDVDEIIVPRMWKTWEGIFSHLFSSGHELEERFASFSVSNAYFFGKFGGAKKDDVFFLKNLNRNHFSPPRESGKSFISTKNALSVFNHYALEVLRPGVSRTYFLPSSAVQLNHYKETCDAMILPECSKYISSPTIVDEIILKYRKLFLHKYNDSLVKMQKSEIL